MPPGASDPMMCLVLSAPKGIGEYTRRRAPSPGFHRHASCHQAIGGLTRASATTPDDTLRGGTPSRRAGPLSGRRGFLPFSPWAPWLFAPGTSWNGLMSTDPSSPDPAAGGAEAFRYVYSPAAADVLRQLGACLMATTYQAGKLIVFHAQGGQLSMLLRTFDRAMGLAADPNRLALATKWQVWTFDNAPLLAPRMPPAGSHDACFLPRTCHVTGAVDVHEIAWAGDELWLVNTLFSCLCTLEKSSSFVPRWRPPFVSRLIRQDRCHLNGLALVNGRPRFVTLFAQTDTAEGWRGHKRDGGCVLDVPCGEVAVRGLSRAAQP